MTDEDAQVLLLYALHAAQILECFISRRATGKCIYTFQDEDTMTVSVQRVALSICLYSCS